VVNVSEGIGTGILANGKLIRGEKGMAGEFGHVQLDPDGPACGCGNNGCWETLASNRAAVRHFVESGGASGTSFGALLSLAHAGDSTAILALERMSMNLGRGLRMIAAALAPKEIVIVGDFTSAWYRFGPMIEAEMHRHALSSNAVLRPAYDGGSARLRSAVALVLNSGTMQ